VGVVVPRLVHDLGDQILGVNEDGVNVGGIIGKYTDDRCQLGGDVDQPVGLVVEGVAERSDGSRSGGQEIAQRGALFGQRAHRLHGGVQRVEKLRGRVAQSGGGRGERRNRRRARVTGDDGVE